MQLLSETVDPPPPPNLPSNKLFADDIDFLVENAVFTVPRRCFQAAEDLNFLTLLRLHLNTEDHGTQSNHCPVVPLQNVRKDAFEALIEVVRSDDHGAMLTQSQWIDVHRLASMWGLKDVKQTAYGEIESIRFRDPVHALRLAHDPTQSLQHWMNPAITYILRREQSLTSEEIAFLGPQLTQKILEIEHSTLKSVDGQGILVDPVSGQQIPVDRSTWDFSEEVVNAVGSYRMG